MRDAGFYSLLYEGAKELGQLVMFVYALSSFLQNFLCLLILLTALHVSKSAVG